MLGFNEVVNEIRRRFPDHDPDWWSKVAFPAFQTCWTVIWGDAPPVIECPECGIELEVVSLDPPEVQEAPEEEGDWGE